MVIDTEATLQKYLAEVRERFVRDGKFDPMEARIFSADGGLTICALPGLDYQEQREAIQRVLALMEPTRRPVLVLHAMEVFYAAFDPKDRAAAARVKQAHRLKEIDKLPDRKEKLCVAIEDELTPIQLWAAEIERGLQDEPVLGDWKLVQTQIPRPTFKRYFPERRGERSTA
jgi:hypothetical protein